MLILSSAQYLSVLHSIRLLNSLVATPIGAALMRQNLPLPFVVVICASAIRYVVTWYLPESAPARQQKKSYEAPLADRDGSNSNSESFQPLLNEAQTDPLQTSHSVWSHIHAFVLDPSILFCFGCFLVKRIAFTSESLMFQYVSEILKEPLNKTSWIRVPLGLSATINTSVGLPALLTFLKRRANSTYVDTWAIRTSLGILVAGFTIFWIFDQPFMMTIGNTSP
jgi:hypothetical protein